MKYRLDLLEPVRTEDAFGAEAVTYVSTRIAHAERVKASGSGQEEVGEHFAAYRVEFNIRDAHKVAERWHVRQLGGYEYNVVAIIPNKDRGMNTLVCERVNP